MSQPFKIASLALLAIAGAPQAALAEWPNDQPIELIVAYNPGGGTDVMFRTMERFLEEALGAEIAILNKPGAGGEIAYTALTQAEPDGYTISSLNTPSFLTTRLDRELTYNPADICPVARMVEDPSALMVQADSEFQNLTDLVEHAKQNPGAVSVGTTGVGSDEHLTLIQLEQQGGIDLTAIPFGGSAETRTALLGGHVTSIGINIGEYLGNDSTGVRLVAQLSDERSALMPDLPTAKEQGFDLVMSSERGVGVRCDVPEAIRTRLAEAVKQVLDNPEFQAQAEKLKLPIAYLTSEEWTQQMPVRLDRFKAIWDLVEK
ncbi:MAG: tripartite tricarboxylate transporter substrate binding protein [Rhizobiales bacterium]|nr:tripartite tricarboxylate transporter substrate binding protein [Hyphomicrobiales bacterium]